MTALEVVFWACIALILWTQIGYALAIGLLARLLAPAPRARSDQYARTAIPKNCSTEAAPAIVATHEQGAPSVSLIVAAHDEQAVIGRRSRTPCARLSARALELIVACDGCSDATALRARAAGADSCSSCRAAARSSPRTPP